MCNCLFKYNLHFFLRVRACELVHDIRLNIRRTRLNKSGCNFFTPASRCTVKVISPLSRIFFKIELADKKHENKMIVNIGVDF